MKRSAVFDCLFAVMCINLLLIGLSRTRGLNWPADLDQFRDIAMTQTILDGQYGHDAYYRGEVMWYNPGYHVLIAGMSLLGGKPVPAVIARHAVLLNLLAPLAFYFLLRALWGAGTAFFASIAYLFSNNAYPDWVSSLFSLSTFPIIISQAFCYATLLIYFIAERGGHRLRHYLACGVMLGVTFLFNVTAAFVCGGIIASTIFFPALSGFVRRRPVAPFALSAVKKMAAVVMPALLVALVFLVPLFVRYRLRVVNLMPVTWQWPPLRFDVFHGLLVAEALQPVNWLALFGFLHVMFSKADGTHRLPRRLFSAWLAICLGYYAYYYLDLRFKLLGINLPSFAPIHNLFFFIKAAVFALSGYGLAALLRWLGTLLQKCIPVAIRFGAALRRRQLVVGVVFCLLASLALTVGLDRVYSQPQKLLLVAMSHVHQEKKRNLIGLYQWIRRHTGSDDVFLCDDVYTMRAVTPAGRKVVATHPFFSNPYVDWRTRESARRRMWGELENGKWTGFFRLNRTYHVKYIILPLFIYRNILPHGHSRFFKLVFRINEDVVLKVRLNQQFQA